VIQITAFPIASWDASWKCSQELAMASIQEVQVAEKKVQAVLRELKTSPLSGQTALGQSKGARISIIDSVSSSHTSAGGLWPTEAPWGVLSVKCELLEDA
jgi:hypothetical protein